MSIPKEWQDLNLQTTEGTPISLPEMAAMYDRKMNPRRKLTGERVTMRWRTGTLLLYP